MVENLHEHAAQRRVRINPGSNYRRSGEREETEHAVAEMVNRQIGNHSLQIPLRPCRECSKHDRADRQQKQPGADDPDLVREKREQQAHETVNAHFGEQAGQHHRDPRRRGLISVRQPGVKRKEWHLHRQSDKDACKSKPGEVAGEQIVFPKTRESRKIECASGQINPEKRKQHRHAAEKCVEEKLGRRAVPIFAAPDFDQQKRRDQAHFVKQEPENEILRGERSVERRLHDEHCRVETAGHGLRQKCKRHD